MCGMLSFVLSCSNYYSVGQHWQFLCKFGGLKFDPIPNGKMSGFFSPIQTKNSVIPVLV